MNEAMRNQEHQTNHQIIHLLGVNIHNVSVDDVIGRMRDAVDNHQKVTFPYVNVHALNLAYENDEFRAILNNSEWVFCDGVGVKLAASLTGQQLNHRFTPPDWIDQLCQSAVENHWRLFFLGSEPGVADLAGHKLILRHPGLEIHSHHGFFDHFGDENELVLDKINQSGAQVILVGMGMPLQERWVKENMYRIPKGYVFLPVGALFNYVAGTIKRGPRWLTDHGFEWLTRLVIEPKRLWHRYIIGNPLFFARILLHRLGLSSKRLI